MTSPGKLARAVIVAAEVCGTELSTLAAETMARVLSDYPSADVARALQRAQREVSGRLTLAAILQRIDSGHLSPDEAWALASTARDEAATVVWTAEIAGAYGVAVPLLAQGDQVAARMSFLAAYRAALQRAQDARNAPRWYASIGHDQRARTGALVTAAECGRLSAGTVRGLLDPSVPGYDDATRRLSAVDGVAYLPPPAAQQPKALKP